MHVPKAAARVMDEVRGSWQDRPGGGSDTFERLKKASIDT